MELDLTPSSNRSSHHMSEVLYLIMRMAVRALALVVPLVLGVLVSMGYTYLNIETRMFADSWGCGCGPFPNTNHLSLAFYSVLVAATATLGWHFSDELPKAWRWGYIVAILGGGLLLFRIFMSHNAWA
jgi:hypothetical protein